jgi:hypothetical protein
VTQPETTLTLVRHDRWSLWPLALALAAVILLWWSIVWNTEPLTTLLVAFAIVVILFAAVIAMLVHLVRRRVHATLSALAAAAIIAGGFAARITILNAVRYADFAIHRAGYEHTVEVWRTKNPGPNSLRLVLAAVDRSTFVVPTIYDYVVYDESDAIGRDPPVPSGNWLCATGGCGIGLTYAGAGSVVVRPFGDHFYFVEQTL